MVYPYRGMRWGNSRGVDGERGFFGREARLSVVGTGMQEMTCESRGPTDPPRRYSPAFIAGVPDLPTSGHLRGDICPKGRMFLREACYRLSEGGLRCAEPHFLQRGYPLIAPGGFNGGLDERIAGL